MIITMRLHPREKAKLMAAAQARGLSAADLVREALEAIFNAASEDAAIAKEPPRSLRGLLAKYGPAPSAEEIDQNRAEMFENFPRPD